MRRDSARDAGFAHTLRLRLAGLVLAAAATVVFAQVPDSNPASAPAAGAVAYIVPIQGEINDILTGSIERRVKEARARGATKIIFEMDTPGGLVTSALDISKLIKKLPADGVRTVAWVNDAAYSAGALISVACQEIVMSSAGRIGDCAPIMIAPVGGVQELGDAERAKAESPVLQDFRDSAARNGYDPLLCRAMVQVGEEVWWLENKTTGTREFVTGADKADRIDDMDEADRVWQVVTSYRDILRDQDVELKQPIDAVNELLTLSQSEAVAFGLARGIADSADALKQKFALAAAPITIEISSWEHFVGWLNSPSVRGIIFIVMLVAAYMEFQSPGLMLPGVVAVVALGVFLGAPYAAGLADIWTFVLLAVGLILIAVEIFLLPGFGLAGVSGVLLIIISFVGTFVPSEPGAPPLAWPRMQGTFDAMLEGVKVLTAALLVSGVGIVAIARYFPRTRLSRGVLLANPENVERLALDTVAGRVQPGDVGVVAADLRPGGRARFGHELFEVQSQGEYVDAGRRVLVVRCDGNAIIVRPIDEPGAAV